MSRAAESHRPEQQIQTKTGSKPFSICLTTAAGLVTRSRLTSVARVGLVPETSFLLTSIFRLLGLRIWVRLGLPLCSCCFPFAFGETARPRMRPPLPRRDGTERLRERTARAKPHAAWAKGGAGGAVVAPWSRGDSLRGADYALGGLILT